MDEVRIWSYARNGTDIQDNMNTELTGSEPGLVAYYKMNEGSGSTLHDATGNGNDLTIYGATWTNGHSVPFCGGSGTSGNPI